jgi:hypothetical protein
MEEPPKAAGQIQGAGRVSFPLPMTLPPYPKWQTHPGPTEGNLESSRTVSSPLWSTSKAVELGFHEPHELLS